MSEILQESRLQRRAARKRAKILKASAHLFAQKGYHGTTVKEIADAADISEGSIYTYFNNKEQLLVALLDRLIELQSTESMYTRTLPADTRSFIYNVFKIQHEFLNDNRELFKAVLPEVILNEKYREKFFNEFYQPSIYYFTLQLQARDVLGQIKPVNHQLASRTLIGLIYGYYIIQLLDDPTVIDKWEDLLEETIALIYGGLSP